MPDAVPNAASPPPKLDLPYTPGHFSATAHLLTFFAAIIFGLGFVGGGVFYIGAPYLRPWLSIAWMAALWIFSAFFAVLAFRHRRVVRRGQDLRLSISAEGVALVETGFSIRRHRLAWRELSGWSIIDSGGWLRIFELTATDGTSLQINPADNTWITGQYEKSVADARALVEEIERLLKFYAGDRQRPTVKSRW